MSGKRSTVLAVICIFAITAAVLFLKRPADPSGQEADIDLGAYVWQKPFDLDGDDVPELLLIRNSSHPDGVTICTYRGEKRYCSGRSAPLVRSCITRRQS